MVVLPIPTGKDEREKLAAVILPNLDYFEKTKNTNINNIIKLELGTLSKDYPPYKRIIKFIITHQEFPKTRLGKLKRYETRNLYLDELLSS